MDIALEASPYTNTVDHEMTLLFDLRNNVPSSILIRPIRLYCITVHTMSERARRIFKVKVLNIGYRLFELIFLLHTLLTLHP